MLGQGGVRAYLPANPVRRNHNGGDGESDEEFADPKVGLYAAREIVTHRQHQRRKVEYLVRWVGYPDNEETWEPASCFKGKGEMLAEYKKAQRKKMRVQAKVIKTYM